MLNNQPNYEQLIETLTMDAENRQVIAIYRAVTGTTDNVERLVTWLLVAAGERFRIFNITADQIE